MRIQLSTLLLLVALIAVLTALIVQHRDHSKAISELHRIQQADREKANELFVTVLSPYIVSNLLNEIESETDRQNLELHLASSIRKFWEKRELIEKHGAMINDQFNWDKKYIVEYATNFVRCLPPDTLSNLAAKIESDVGSTASAPTQTDSQKFIQLIRRISSEKIDAENAG